MLYLKNNNRINGWTFGITITILLLIGSAVLSYMHLPAFAQEVDELKDKIEDRNNRIQQLEEDIQEYEQQLSEIEGRQQTLENKIQQLEVNRQRLTADIELTQEKINTKNNQINKLQNQIEQAEKDITKNRSAIANAIRKIHKVEETSLAEKMLSKNSLAEMWETVDTLEKFQLGLQNNLQQLRELKAEVASNKEQEEEQRSELVQLRQSLEGKRAVVRDQKQQQNRLLEQTENKESNYQQILTEKRRQKEQFEQQLQQFEQQLQIAIDDSKIPEKGATVFRYPFEQEVQITQQFGGTRFAKQNPQAYGRPFHNGTDFGLSVGTELTPVMPGKVVGTGNTDAVPGCYSYGKWVLVEHNNGLSTLYAHLSVISTEEGQNIQQGQRLGYSGNSGYSTGPHLHLTTYATEGVRIVRLGEVKEQTNCGQARIPVAATDAYLNSMSYLPEP